ncbi:uncharacterized protein LOC108488411 isoform X1 [Gossypium arboreum]|nr:uncharacterized protein LOC108488411 isoform X1 [Gossypium arboreum]
MRDSLLLSKAAFKVIHHLELWWPFQKNLMVKDKTTKAYFLNLQAFCPNQLPNFGSCLIYNQTVPNMIAKEGTRCNSWVLLLKIWWSKGVRMSLLLQITRFLPRKMKMVEQYERELAVGVAAAAYVVNAIEKDEAKYRIKIEGKKQDTISRVGNSDRVSRRYSSKEVITNTAGETSSRKSRESSKGGGSSAGDQRWKGNYSQTNNALETKADAWQNAELHKLNKRYENMKASIHEWEKENKVRAKVKMERRKKELEKKIKRSHQVYQLKISRIDDIAGGARAQVDDKRRNEELKIREKAKQL